MHKKVRPALFTMVLGGTSLVLIIWMLIQIDRDTWIRIGIVAAGVLALTAITVVACRKLKRFGDALLNMLRSIGSLH